MKFLALASVFVSVIPAIAALTINTPTGVVQCQPIMLSFNSGVPPYYVSAIPGGQVSAAPLRTWDPTTSNSLTWVVDIAGGTAVSFIVKDSTGAQAFSDSVNIQVGPNDATCLNHATTATHAAGTTASNANHATSTSAGTSGSAARTTATQTASSHAANVNANGAADVGIVMGVHWVVGALGVAGGLLL